MLSNSGPETVEAADAGTASTEQPARVWTFADTPPLSTYVVVVNAGPFVELRREADGYDLGLYARQSLARYLDRDADELFELTRAGAGVVRRRSSTCRSRSGATTRSSCPTWAVPWRTGAASPGPTP